MKFLVGKVKQVGTCKQKSKINHIICGRENKVWKIMREEEQELMFTSISTTN